VSKVPANVNAPLASWETTAILQSNAQLEQTETNAKMEEQSLALLATVDVNAQ